MCIRKSPTHDQTFITLSSCWRLAFLAVFLLGSNVVADVRVPSIFGDHMVLQQGQQNKVWGKASSGEGVTVSIGDQKHAAVAGDDGSWSVMLDSMPAGGPHEMTVKGKNTLTVSDVLVGEVWVCSGQSNMAWRVRQAKDADLESRAANFPKLRMINVPQVGTQEPQDDFDGQWAVCSPETVGDFSAVGYFFGRQLHQTLNVPIGLINNAWGGSACEAWIRRDILTADERFQPLMAWWAEQESGYDFESAMAAFQRRMQTWRRQAAEARAAGKQPPARPRSPSNLMTGNQRPANIYNGVLRPTIGYGIKGAIWYQGESNASRAYQYRDLFPLMIQSWRTEWEQGDFPFYWVQLADFRAEQADPQESDWAELREAQSLTMSELPNTGEAVILNLGEGRDIHPRNKQDVAMRLARWAMARDYGVDIPYRSPNYKSMRKDGSKIVLTFENVGPSGLYTFDVTEPVGFAIAGADKKFVWAKAELAGKDQVVVWSHEVAEPVAVRYAWADNPVCNLQNREGLPVNPFRTDDWPGVTSGNNVR